MNVTLDLSPEQEIQLRNSLRKRDRQKVHQILTEAINPTIDTLLESNHRLSLLEFEQLSRKLVDQVALATGSQTPDLRDEDTNRAGIYQDHP